MPVTTRCFTIGTGSPRLSVERAGACLLAMVAFFMLPWPEWELGSKTDV